MSTEVNLLDAKGNPVARLRVEEDGFAEYQSVRPMRVSTVKISRTAPSGQARSLAAAELTLSTLRDWAERMARLDGPDGYDRAVRDVQAILDSHGKPPGEPVMFGEVGP